MLQIVYKTRDVIRVMGAKQKLITIMFLKMNVWDSLNALCDILFELQMSCCKIQADSFNSAIFKSCTQ